MLKDDKSTKPHRKSLRLPYHDYSQEGWYFVTICTKDMKQWFGKCEDGEMELNEIGRIVRDEWVKSSFIRNEIELDEYIIMPNHIHGIVVITSVGANGRSPLRDNKPTFRMKPRSLSSLIAGFKSSTTKQINMMRRTPSVPVWQRNYYEHVIRSDHELEKIREYIFMNPNSWHLDKYYSS